MQLLLFICLITIRRELCHFGQQIQKMNGMRSFVEEYSFLPFFLSCLFSTAKVIEGKHSIAIIFEVVSNQPDVFFWPGLIEFTLFEIIDPYTFVYLSLCFVLVSSFAVFLVIFPLAFKYVSVSVDHLTVSLHFVVYEISLINIVQPCNLKTTMTFSLVLDESSLVHIAVPVVDNSVTVEMPILESSFISFILESVDALSIFLIIPKLAIIDCSASLNQNSTPRLLSHNKLASIFSVLTKISQFSLAVKFIVSKLALIFDLSFEFIDSTTVFLTITELSRIGSTISLLQCSIVELIVLKSALKFLSIRIDELAVITMFIIVFHATDVLGSVGITDSPINEISTFELPIKSSVSFLPDAFTVGTAFFKVSLVGVSIGIQKFPEGGVSFIKVTFELGSIFVQHKPFSVGSAQLIYFPGVGPSFARLSLVCFWLISTAQRLSHDLINQIIQIKSNQLFSSELLDLAESSLKFDSCQSITSLYTQTLVNLLSFSTL